MHVFDIILETEWIIIFNMYINHMWSTEYYWPTEGDATVGLFFIIIIAKKSNIQIITVKI